MFHQATKDVCHRHLKISDNHRSYYADFCVHDTPALEAILRETVHKIRDKFTVLCTSYIGEQDTTADNTMMIGDLELNKPDIKWFMSHLRTSPTTTSLYDHIIDGTAITVSDGSFFPHSQVGACAWILSTPDSKEWVEG